MSLHYPNWLNSRAVAEIEDIAKVITTTATTATRLGKK